jgi:hypothetical protein
MVCTSVDREDSIGASRSKVDANRGSPNRFDASVSSIEDESVRRSVINPRVERALIAGIEHSQ